MTLPVGMLPVGMLPVGIAPIVAGTGHRPDKLGGYEPCAMHAWVKVQIHAQLEQLQPLYIISGMALGFDQFLAEVAIERKIPFVAAVPFKGQQRAWHPPQQEIYRTLLARAVEIVIVSEGGYSNEKMQIRNMWMVDHCNILLACFNGSPGGTANCVNYANRMRREIARIDPRAFEGVLCA